MLNQIENYYFSKSEELQACFLAYRKLILDFDTENIREHWKFGTPFFYYKGKMFCYLWSTNKGKTNYVSFLKGSKMNHPALVGEKRKIAKVLHIDLTQDIDIVEFREILLEASLLY